MKKGNLLAAILMIALLLSGCGSSLNGKSSATDRIPASEDIAEAHASQTEQTARDQKKEELLGAGLKDLQLQYHTVPVEYTDGMLLEESKLYPLPEREAAELGYLWKYHRIRVEKAVWVDDVGNDKSSLWYLVSPGEGVNETTDYCFIGWLPAEVVCPYESDVTLPVDAKYRLKKGVTFYWEDGTMLVNEGENLDFSSYKLLEVDQQTGRVRLDAGSGKILLVDSMDDIEADPAGIWSPSWLNAG